VIIHEVDALNRPGLEPYRTMRRPADHERRGIFVAEGEKVVRRLLASPLGLRSLLLTPEWHEVLRPETARRDTPSLEIFLAPHDVMEGIVGFRFHQGVMAVGEVPPEPPVDSLPRPHLLVALERIHHVENVGVIIRNAAGLGADGVVVGEASCSPYLRRAVRNSMGSAFTTPIFRPTNMTLFLRSLQERYGTRILAADPLGATPAWSEDFSGNICVVVGNEDAGVSGEIRALADALIAIPMADGVDSLNAGSAAAALLYEAARQRFPRPEISGRVP
jgi:tRNA G18 (ribose-2'-O)-methylase SpoU